MSQNLETAVTILIYVATLPVGLASAYLGARVMHWLLWRNDGGERW